MCARARGSKMGDSRTSVRLVNRAHLLPIHICVLPVIIHTCRVNSIAVIHARASVLKSQ